MLLLFLSDSVSKEQEVFVAGAIVLEILKIFQLESKEIEQTMLAFLKEDVQCQLDQAEFGQRVADCCAGKPA